MSADPLIMPPERSPSPAVRATAERAAARVSQKRAGIVRSELGLIFGVATLFIFQLFGTPWVANLQNTAKAVGLFLWLFAAILALSFGVVRHADCLAVLLGEPYGTLILTLSVIGIEAAMMAQLMLNGEDSPTLARDTMFSVLMIVLTGIVGVTLLLGGLFNPQQQEFNLSGALSYLRVLTPMAILSLVVPRFTRKDGGEIWGPLGVWLFCMSGSLYGVFLYHQTKTHSYYFDQPPERGGAGQSQSQSPRRDEDSGSISSDLERQQQLATPGMHDRHPRAVAEDDEGGGHARRRDRRGSIGVVAPVVVTPTHGHEDMEVRTTRYHAVLLFVTMLPVVLLAKYMSKMIKYVISETRMPQELGGFLVAVLILSPESLTAVKAALAPNQLQRTVNIALGSATSTIGMTVPVALTVAFLTNREEIELGLDYLQITELALTLVTCMLTFGTGTTNYLQGVVHLMLFVSYIFLIFDGGKLPDDHGGTAGPPPPPSPTPPPAPEAAAIDSLSSSFLGGGT